MGLYMGLGMDLLASTFDVESVVFLKRDSLILAFSGSLYGLGDGLVGANFRYRKCGLYDDDDDGVMM